MATTIATRVIKATWRGRANPVQCPSSGGSTRVLPIVDNTAQTARPIRGPKSIGLTRYISMAIAAAAKNPAKLPSRAPAWSRAMSMTTAPRENPAPAGSGRPNGES